MRHVCRVPGLAMVLVIVTLASGACSSGERRLPAGPALTVVLATSDRTLAAGPANVIVADPGRSEQARVDLTPPLDGIESDAVAALDLVRGAVQADHYGGQGVRGVSTMRYDVSVDFAQALARTPAERRAALERLGPGGSRLAEIAVWVDVDGRARRVQRSLELGVSPPVTTADGFPAVVTTDYYGFG